MGFAIQLSLFGLGLLFVVNLDLPIVDNLGSPVRQGLYCTGDLLSFRGYLGLQHDMPIPKSRTFSPEPVKKALSGLDFDFQLAHL